MFLGSSLMAKEPASDASHGNPSFCSVFLFIDSFHAHLLCPKSVIEGKPTQTKSMLGTSPIYLLIMWWRNLYRNEFFKIVNYMIRHNPKKNTNAKQTYHIRLRSLSLDHLINSFPIFEMFNSMYTPSCTLSCAVHECTSCSLDVNSTVLPFFVSPVFG